MLEREAELALIGQALAAARARAGGPLLVIGPAGIGKTTLLSIARELAVHQDFCVLEGRASSLEEDFSFGVARQLFERMLADAGTQRNRLLAGAAGGAMIALEGAAVGTVSDLDRRFAAIHGLYWLAVIVAERQPLLLSVDDLQWADRASLRWIAYLAGRLADLPIALMLSWRQGEVMPGDGSLARIEEVAGSRRLEPAPLSREAARELLAHRLDRSPGERVLRAAHTVCGGNPFLLQHVGEALLAETAADEDAAVEWVQQLGPPGVTRFVRLRIERLGEDACRLADALAVLGDEAQLRHVAELCDFQLQRAALAADKLAGIGVVGPGTSLRYVHAIVRSAVYAGIPTAQRSLLHARAAKMLARDGEDLDRVCSHLLLAEPDGSAEITVQLRTAAARAARRGALESASAYLSRALRETVDPGLRLELLHELGRVEQVMRDPGAAMHLREALELADDPRRSAVVASDLSHVLLMDGRWVESFSMLQTARRALEATDSPRRDDALSVQLEATWAYFVAYDPELVVGVQGVAGLWAGSV